MTAALLLTGALLTTACSNEDEAAVNINNAQTVTFTATLAPKDGASRDQSQACSSFGEAQPALAEGKGGATTRAITVSNQNTSNETLTTAWKKNEKIAVYYQKNDDTYATATATVGEPNADGSAPISATLTNAKDGSVVKFVYPAWLANATGDDIDEDKLLTQQNGQLRTGTTNISKNFDAATGSGTLSVSAGTAVTSDRIAMENRVCICRIELKFHNGSNLVSSGGNTLTIAVGSERTYTISSPKESMVQSPGQPTQYEPFETGDIIYMAMLPVVSQRVTFLSFDGSNIYRFISNNVNLSAGKFYRNIPLTLTEMATTNRTLTTNDGVVELQDGDIVSGTGGANTRLKIADGAVVYLRDVTNTDITQEASIPGIKCLGDATIILSGTNNVTGRWNAAGIFVHEGKTLTIMGVGSLHATGGGDGAGIGGTKETSCGNIRIEGGTITATGTGECAGIGSGGAYSANITCGNITITGGTVTAQGGVYAAGIGSGHASQAKNTCGAITISGGTVTATGGKYAAGIGSGNGNHNQGNPYVSACGAISITGGTVEATSGDRGAGIGGGSDGSFTSISIGSGITRVTATRSNDYENVPIGKGFDDQNSGAVTFDGVTMHTGKINEWDNGSWVNWPEDGGPFGGIQVTASDYGSNNGRTWTLTPKN